MSNRTIRGLLVPALLLFTLAAAPAATAHTVARGLADVRLTEASPDHRVRIMKDCAQLRVAYLRLGLEWPRAKTAPGVYDEIYLAAFDDVAALAQERDLWSEPPGGYKSGVYLPFYAPEREHVDDFGAFATYLSRRLAGKVFAYGCWNEPNLWPFCGRRHAPATTILRSHATPSCSRPSMPG